VKGLSGLKLLLAKLLLTVLAKLFGEFIELLLEEGILENPEQGWIIVALYGFEVFAT